MTPINEPTPEQEASIIAELSSRRPIDREDPDVKKTLRHDRPADRKVIVDPRKPTPDADIPVLPSTLAESVSPAELDKTLVSLVIPEFEGIGVEADIVANHLVRNLPIGESDRRRTEMLRDHLMQDQEWKARLMAGDHKAKSQLRLISLILASPVLPDDEAVKVQKAAGVTWNDRT
jgi:hypothetical protein